MLASPSTTLIGFDIGGTKCAVVIGEARSDGCKILAREAFATLRGPEQNLSKLASTACAMLKGLEIREAASIGISCGGPLDAGRGIVLSPPNLPGWDGIEIVDYFETALGLPAQLENDANACALAEHQWGAGRGSKNMVFLTFGTGMGAGLILDSQLYRGSSDLAGEIGHVRVAEDGPKCYGKRGSFEGLCSGAGVAISGKARGIIPETGSCKDVFSAATTDQAARTLVEETAVALGRGIAIIVDLINPEVIVIGSIYARQEHILRERMLATLRDETIPQAMNACRVVPSQLGESIGDWGTLSVALQKTKQNTQ